MKHSIIRAALLCLLGAILVVACGRQPQSVELTDWQLEYEGQLLSVRVPSFVHQDLIAHGIIADPYFGTNEDSAQWVGERSWTYSTMLRRGDLPKGDTLWLIFDGLAGNASIYLDGMLLGHADNMFHPWRYALTQLADSALLQVRFFPQRPIDQEREEAYGIALPDRRACSRIAPYQQGWDWGLNALTYGIWQPVRIEAKLTEKPVKKLQSWNVELRQEADSIGQTFTFYQDGKPLYIKGVNWIPVHTFPILNAEQKARYRYLLTSAKEANMNMIRIWGGGIYEHDYFYELCDSLGLMVWQDFNFSCELYPDTEAMLESISEEAAYQVERIAQHPCVVLWCGNNEVKNGWEDWGWQEQYHWSDEQRARLAHAIDTIFGEEGILAQTVRKYDPCKRQYISTSPLYGWGHPECTTHGDSHYWGVWWGELPFEVYREKTGRFMSEYGFQSYPLMSAIKQYAPREEWNIDSPSLRSHQKHSRGRAIIDGAMQRYYGFDSRSLTLEEYAYCSQLLQAWGTGYGILCHLQAQPHCMGTLYWQLNDTWPVASWSSIDYFGNWKALHYRVRELYADTTNLSRWSQYYSTYPKNRHYDTPRYEVRIKADGSVEVSAQTDLYDLYLEPVPFCNGHFSDNFFDLRAGESRTLRFISSEGEALTDSIRTITLNHLYTKQQ